MSHSGLATVVNVAVSASARGCLGTCFATSLCGSMQQEQVAGDKQVA